tara:strand:- start:1091 stop:1549 length:459 start_codon:yes stop_codon:yes gene_type:complete
MANSTIVGNATVYGVDGTVAYGTVAVADNYMQTFNLTDDVDTAEARDQKGNVFGYNLYNFRRTATFEIIFIDSDEAGAAAEVKLPAPGAIVTIAQDAESGNTFPAILAGTWNYSGGGSISMSNTDILRMTLPCSKYCNDAAGDAVALQSFGH